MNFNYHKSTVTYIYIDHTLYSLLSYFMILFEKNRSHVYCHVQLRSTNLMRNYSKIWVKFDNNQRNRFSNLVNSRIFFYCFYKHKFLYLNKWARDSTIQVFLLLKLIFLNKNLILLIMWRLLIWKLVSVRMKKLVFSVVY